MVTKTPSVGDRVKHAFGVNVPRPKCANCHRGKRLCAHRGSTKPNKPVKGRMRPDAMGAMSHADATAMASRINAQGRLPQNVTAQQVKRAGTHLQVAAFFTAVAVIGITAFLIGGAALMFSLESEAGLGAIPIVWLAIIGGLIVGFGIAGLVGIPWKTAALALVAMIVAGGAILAIWVNPFDLIKFLWGVLKGVVS